MSESVIKHKAVQMFRGQDLYLPLCRVFTDPTFRFKDVVKRNWKDVTCEECLKMKKDWHKRR